FNNSPDTLRGLDIKLLLNIHKPGATRTGSAAPEYLTDGVQIDRFAANGTAVPWGPDDGGPATWRGVRLPAPLMPHDSITLAFDWHVELARQSNREGMLDPTSLFLAYFYPRVAVYDDYDGWDRMDFTDSQEFYSDFNDYDVTIRAPRNYVVWGTGTLANADQVLQVDPLQRYNASLRSDEVIHVATKADMANRAVTRQDSILSWHFTATNVPDMAFGVSDHYTWDAGSVVVDRSSGRRASVQAAYVDTSADYRHMVRFAKQSLDWFSNNWPGVPYPYEKTTVFQGIADMEYPMMVNDNTFADTSFARFVAAHEIAHTWFPFYMGINESRYGFMDEGWATTFEYLINQSDMGKTKAADLFKQFRVAGWINDPSPLEDLPIITPADMLKFAAYGNNAYGKPALGYLAVKDMLGDVAFRKALHAYIENWHGKHPTPWDFFNSFNTASGQNLDWFWRNWFFSNGYIDLAVGSVKKGATGSVVTVKNVGGMAAPFDLIVTRAGGAVDTLHQTSAVWRANQAEARITVKGAKAITSVVIDGGIWMDAVVGDNSWKGR
ncbi:MAG: M1 family metallopeptidase, partial [Gemmatimonadales bacterium]